MKSIIESLRVGNWRTLLACFLYFDTGFTAWVMFGPLAPYIAGELSLTPLQSAFLVAVPVLSASIVRISFGNLFQTVSGRPLALLGIGLSALPALWLLTPIPPSYTMLLVLGAFLGVGGASFAIALPMAAASYPPQVQGLVLGLAAAGNVGAVMDGFLFPTLAAKYGWQPACFAVLPLLALAALAMILWGRDGSAKAQGAPMALAGFVLSFTGFIAGVLLCAGGLLGSAQTSQLLLPLAGSALALALLPRRHRAVLAQADTWVVMLVYSITFGGFVGMSSYVSLLLTAQYGLSKVDAGVAMAALSFTGAMVRPVGGLIADRLSGVRVLLGVLAAIALCNSAFAWLVPSTAGALALLAALYVCFGLGNGATFQLVPHRWRGQTGVMTGIIGAAGGIGGFDLPMGLGLARETTGTYAPGFAALAGLALLALLVVGVLKRQWLTWAAPASIRHTGDGVPLPAAAE